jgi:hypothetical protein
VLLLFMCVRSPSECKCKKMRVRATKQRWVFVCVAFLRVGNRNLRVSLYIDQLRQDKPFLPDASECADTVQCVDSILSLS